MSCRERGGRGWGGEQGSPTGRWSPTSGERTSGAFVFPFGGQEARASRCFPPCDLDALRARGSSGPPVGETMARARIEIAKCGAAGGPGAIPERSASNVRVDRAGELPVQPHSRGSYLALGALSFAANESAAAVICKAGAGQSRHEAGGRRVVLVLRGARSAWCSASAKHDLAPAWQNRRRDPFARLTAR